MIRPAESAAPAGWLVDPAWHWGDVTVRGLLPAFPAYARIENRGEEPLYGVMDRLVAELLYNGLAAATTTPDTCHFAVWDGYAGVPETPATAEVRGRTYRLFDGAVTDALALDAKYGQTPNYAWPDDRAWCVAADIDLPISVVGCQSDIADKLLVTLGLRANLIAPGASLVGEATGS